MATPRIGDTKCGSSQKYAYNLLSNLSTCHSHHLQDRIVYAIHGGPMAGRLNFQEATYQCIRPGELWQCNWLEETGTICSLVYDIPKQKITTLLGFSKGHWENAEAAHGDKRNQEDLDRWRGLAKLGSQVERFMLSEQAHMVETFRGNGDLEPIEESWATL